MSDTTKDATDTSKRPRDCGLIMPISDHPDYEVGHWLHTRFYITRAIKEANLLAAPVWEQSDTDIIQEKVVTNIYEMPFAVCDVSSRNANVMLELGMRLSFGKPVVIVTDDIDKLPFDISLMTALPYPKNLNMPDMEKFIDALTRRLRELVTSVDAGTYKPFIAKFGPIKAGTLGGEDRDAFAMLLKRLDVIEGRLLPHRASFEIGTTIWPGAWPPAHTTFREPGPGRQRMLQHLHKTGMREQIYSASRMLSDNELQELNNTSGITAIYQDLIDLKIHLLLDGSFDEATFASISANFLSHLATIDVRSSFLHVGRLWAAEGFG